LLQVFAAGLHAPFVAGAALRRRAGTGLTVEELARADSTIANLAR
jgi:hypothetical protein